MGDCRGLSGVRAPAMSCRSPLVPKGQPEGARQGTRTAGSEEGRGRAMDPKGASYCESALWRLPRPFSAHPCASSLPNATRLHWGLPKRQKRPPRRKFKPVQSAPRGLGLEGLSAGARGRCDSGSRCRPGKILLLLRLVLEQPVRPRSLASHQQLPDGPAGRANKAPSGHARGQGQLVDLRPLLTQMSRKGKVYDMGQGAHPATGPVPGLLVLVLSRLRVQSHAGPVATAPPSCRAFAPGTHVCRQDRRLPVGKLPKHLGDPWVLEPELVVKACTGRSLPCREASLRWCISW